jgi:hypothetical protein
MNLAAFKSSAGPPNVSIPLRALWHEANGDWEKAHDLLQQDDSAASAWVHAYLHRKEGDISNAAYWYSRARKPVATDGFESEWDQIASSLLGET